MGIPTVGSMYFQIEPTFICLGCAHIRGGGWSSEPLNRQHITLPSKVGQDSCCVKESNLRSPIKRKAVKYEPNQKRPFRHILLVVEMLSHVHGKIAKPGLDIRFYSTIQSPTATWSSLNASRPRHYCSETNLRQSLMTPSR